MLKKTVTSPCLYQLKDGTIGNFGLSLTDYLVVAVGCLLLFYMEWKQEQGIEIRKTLEKKHPFIQWICLLVPLILLCIFGIFRGSGIRVEFIYQQF